jgi:hypothetical protein
MPMKHTKLSAREVWMLLFLAERCGLSGRMTLPARLRERTVPLWRRELVEIWSKQVPGEGARGPYFSLSVDGHRLASSILAGRDEHRRRKSEGAPLPTEPPSALAA